MTRAEAYLDQATSDFGVFRLLTDQSRQQVPECHPLHYLQMATEKLAKAAYLALEMEDFDFYSHVAFSTLRHHLSRRDIARSLGYKDFRTYQAFLRRTAPLHRRVDELHPGVGPQRADGGAREGPNVEYPWRGRRADESMDWQVPAEHDFGLLRTLRDGDGHQMLLFVQRLLDRFHAVFP